MLVNPLECFGRDKIRKLVENPSKFLDLRIGTHNLKCGIVIPDIASEIKHQFSEISETDNALKNMPFKHFGFIVEFEKEIGLNVFNKDLQLNSHLKYVVSMFGVCIFKNIKLENPAHTKFHKNIFPDLVFHIDRGDNFSNQFSLFYRDPDDPEHRFPRRTTTLIMPKAAAHLQAVKENCVSSSTLINCKLFNDMSAEHAIGKYMVEQKWDAPELNGEICFFDNRTVLHASYHRGNFGYPISVQYLF